MQRRGFRALWSQTSEHAFQSRKNRTLNRMNLVRNISAPLPKFSSIGGQVIDRHDIARLAKILLFRGRYGSNMSCAHD
ncbi:hypothetical protein LshimejAT787_2600170 [Lyophyllum shimeji]|uniref:Uncharacterized protein n=1 Tax=Lyophyllum shimeji TaxID=47721 RepID=A0A9P3URZ4_LYOSH|nr:hypothetical protein LshimejAT787_2600170 [Lyophyllum shimeji]